MFNIIFLLLVFPSISFASGLEIEIYCKRDISHSYINGIMNTQIRSASESALTISQKITSDKKINTAFNQSKGIVLDIKDSLFQKIEESKSIPNRIISWTWSKTNLSNYIDNRVEVINYLNKNASSSQEHIVFSHSQGNLYANVACRSEELNLKFHNIQIASPASRIECGQKNHYTTINSDEMYVLVDSTARGRLNIEDDSPYSFLLKELGLTLGRPVGALTNMEPPMKANITQSTRTIASVLNEKSPDAKLFKNHLIDNYLSFPSSLKNIQNNYHQIYNRLKPDDVVLTSKKTIVSCANIEKFVGKDILEPNFNVKGKPFSYSIFKTHRINKTLIDGKYVFTETFIWWKGLLFLILSVPMLLLFIKFIPFIFLAMSSSEDEEEEQVQE